MAVFSDFVSFLLLFDYQEAFHCCLVVACSNRINMISIQCHRVGQSSIPARGNRAYITFKPIAPESAPMEARGGGVPENYPTSAMVKEGGSKSYTWSKLSGSEPS